MTTNSTENKELLGEDLTTPNAPNIETTDENLSVDVMFQQSSLPSLARQIFPVVPMEGPTGALFNIRKKANGDFELVRANVECGNVTAIHTGVTQEAIQDLRSMYGKEASAVIGKLLRGAANTEENTKTLAFLNSNSFVATGITFTDSLNATTNIRELTQRVQELVIQANSKTLNTYDAFCVIPGILAASIATLPDIVRGDKKISNLYVGKLGGTKYFINPDPADTATVYVGLVDDENYSKSGAVFSPYRSTVKTATNADDGSETYHIFNRYAITASPLHDIASADTSLLFKFPIVV